MDFPFLFRTSDFFHKVAEVLGLLGAFRGSSGLKFCCLGDRAPVTLAIVWGIY
jgi:hypothetical protein